MFKSFMNKRTTRRREFENLLKCSFSGENTDVVLNADVRDVSVNGFAIESNSIFRVGAVIKGELPFPFLDTPIKFVGKIARAQKLEDNKYLYGIAFNVIDKTEQATIGTYVEKINLDYLLASAIRKRATSVHLAQGFVPACRVDGKVLHLDVVTISEEDMERIVLSILNETQKANLYKDRELDFSYTLVKENRRFRMNIFFDKGHLAFVAKLINNEIKSFEELGLPAVLNEMVDKKRGLVIISGPVDSGKSTTLAAIIENINKKHESIIMSIEDPIEYVYESKNSLIHQREVGVDTLSFSGAIRSTLRQDADVVLVGEMRDLDSISQAITAAEEGQLVLSTLHTINAIECFNRLVDVFPANQQEQIRTQLASCMECIVCQHLLPRADGNGRVLATEVLMFTTAVRNLIRKGHPEQIFSYIESGTESGMHTMDSSLLDLLRRGLITHETASAFVTKKNVLGELH